MRRYRNLSYPIDEKSPLYPGTPKVKIRQVKDKNKGDSCNTFFLGFSNHTGTHIDGPRHFFSSAKGIDGYSAKDLVFYKPLLVNCLCPRGGVIQKEDLKKVIKRDDFDALLIRTGFSKYRNRQDRIYCYENPCISSGAAKWLKTRFPGLKAVGIDCISISSYTHRDLGRQAHKAFLGKYAGSRPILIIEDMFIPSSAGKIRELFIAPLLIKGIDSAPCSVIGIEYD